MVGMLLQRFGLTQALGVVALALSVLLVAPTAAHAQSTAKLEAALKRASQDYDMLRIPEAESRLEKAIRGAVKKGNTQPVVARLYVMLGIVRFAVSRDEQDAFEQFTEALQVDSGAVIDPDYETPTLKAIMDRARANLPADSGGGEPEVIGRPEISHTPIESAKAGDEINFVVEVPETVPLYRVVLNYRHYGQTEFKTKDMLPDTKTRFVVTLGSDQVVGSQIDYFIEVMDRTGGILVAAGTPSSPLNIIIFGGDADDIPDDPSTPSSGQFMFIQIGGGGGVGVATARPEVNSDLEIDPGLAPAFAHILSEVGLILSPSLNVGLFHRFQIEPGSLDQDHLVGLKLKWWFDNEGPWKLYSAVGGGYGRVRHTVNLAPVRDFVDTTREGPFHGGVGFGTGYQVTEHIMIAGDVYTLFLFPDISGHIDGTLGLRFSF